MDRFSIPEIASRLEKHPKIEHVYYWHRDNSAYETIRDYMEHGIEDS
ncbi:MAG: hypothetical protein GF364_20160, partial [Candidatus Lokiarchaeota archaeon]|nr:hypothetical protein [Candidatus Lokiarchaeota archaeon]